MLSKCPVCKRIVKSEVSKMDYTVMEVHESCKCGWHYSFVTGNQEEGFVGRWMMYPSGWHRDMPQRRYWWWRRTWWILKPTFILFNKLESRYYQFERRFEPKRV